MSTGNKLNKNRIALNLEIHDFVYSAGSFKSFVMKKVGDSWMHIICTKNYILHNINMFNIFYSNTITVQCTMYID